MDDFTQGSLECALWLADDNPGSGEWSQHDDYTIAHIDPDDLARMTEECRRFQFSYKNELTQAHYAYGYSWAKAGHDFYLTRNGHGAGFWDGDLPEKLGVTLTDAAKAYGAQDLYQGDDGRLYLS